MTTEDEEFLQKKNLLLKNIQKGLKRSQKQLLQREQTLHQCQNWKAVEHEGLLLQANLFRVKKGFSQISVSDWEQENIERVLHLDPMIEPKDQAVQFFKKSKKLRKGLPHAERLLQATKDDLSQKELLLETIENLSSTEDLKLFLSQSNFNFFPKPKIAASKGLPVCQKPFHQFISKTGLHIWVGKSAKGNDQMTFRHAKGSDWWLHARDYPGSHVILRCSKGESPDPESINEAAELALRYSKACKNKEGEVSISQVKYLSRIVNYPGKVQLSKHQVIYIKFDDSRWERLKSHKIND